MAKYKIIGDNSDLVRVVNGNGSVTTFGKGSLEYDQFIQQIHHSCIHPSVHSFIRSFDQSIDPSMNESINQTINP